MRVSIPHMGKYSDIIVKGLGDYLGWEIVISPAPSEKTIELGTKYMNELMCLPAKVTLGSFIEACELGATDFFQFDSCGKCRLTTYWILQQQVLRKLGYNVTVHPVRLSWRTPADIRAIDPSISYWKAWIAFINILRQIIELDKKTWYEIPEESNLVKIGIVGEIYCYSDDTEILTDKGWVLFKDLTNERVVQTDPATMEMWLIKPKGKYCFDYEGKMVELRNQRINLLVTPNHKLLYETRGGQREISEVSKLKGRIRLFRAGEWVGGQKIDNKRFGKLAMNPEQYCKFMAIWLAEGCVVNYRERNSRMRNGYRQRYTTCITQKDEWVRERIEELLTEIGANIDYNHYSKASCGSYRIENKELWLYLKQFGKARDKFIPLEILNAKQKYLEIFLEWFFYGDGGFSSDDMGARMFYSSSKKLIDGIQVMLTKLNRMSSIVWNKTAKQYSLREIKRNFCWVYPKHRREIDYKGKVYSVEVDTGFIMVRRDGKPCVCGNTILEPTVNKDLIKKIEKMGALVHNSLPLSYFIFKGLYNRGWMKRDGIDRQAYLIARKKAHILMPKEVGGHGNESIIHTIYYGLKQFDGVIHILPFPCSPEAVVAPIIDDVSKEYEVPVMRLVFDTHTGEAGLNTRLEAFVDILKRKKEAGRKHNAT